MSIEQQVLAFKSFGAGRPILFIHGWTISGTAEAADFEPVFKETTQYRRIYIDLPGMGSSPANNIQTLEDIYLAIADFITQNLGSESFLLVGTSCGAYLARAIAFAFSDRVLGLLFRVPLVDPDNTQRDIDTIRPVLENQAVLAQHPALKRKAIPVHTKDYLAEYQKKWDDVIAPAIAMSNAKILDAIRDDNARYRLDRPVHTDAHPFTKPTLIMTGRQDDVVGYRDAWKLLASYTRASFVLLDRADHGFPIDEKRLFKVLVWDWLARIEEGSARSTSAGQ